MSNPQILIHRTDTSLDDEFRQAMAKLSQFRPVLHFTSELRDTVAAANDFQPSVVMLEIGEDLETCLLYTSPSPRDRTRSRMPSSA